MNFRSAYLPYEQTAAFSAMVLDYIRQDKMLQPFYACAPDREGILRAIRQRQQGSLNRALLVEELQQQYLDTPVPAVQQNIERLLDENTFTVTTAHQPNIFTGHLYFVYKILHAIRLADDLKNSFPQYHFVPVYYMGSEDADLEELGQVTIGGETYHWRTSQHGAVGRMKVDKALRQLIDDMAGQLSIHPHGGGLVQLLKEVYTEGTRIETATFKLVNELFGRFGLVIFLPDNPRLKKIFNPIVEKELLQQFSHTAVAACVAALPAKYKVQAAGRDLNLFYLKDDMRERIEVSGENFAVANTRLVFTQEQLLAELEAFPDRFSANVILRPVFQEMLLPNVAFIGGGGEIAYWLELKKVFEAAGQPFPVLVLRNSFLLMEKTDAALQEKLGLTTAEIFGPENELLTQLVKRQSRLQLELTREKEDLRALYEQIRSVAANIDSTLLRHSDALKHQALKKIEVLEKKMLKAEKRKHEALQRQLHKLKTHLFPGGVLQERVENFMPYYAKWGSGFIDAILEASGGLEQQFCILQED